MSTKRQPSKQRRQTQNQRQRAALEARRVNAATGGVPDGKVGGGASSSRSGASSGGGSVLSRLRGASASGRAIRTGQPAGGLPVGHRAALSALLAAAAAALVGSFFIKLPVDRSGEAIGTRGALVAEWSLSALDEVRDDPGATPEEIGDAVGDWLPGGEEPYAQALWPLSLGVVLPVAGAGLAFRAVSKRAPAKVVNRTMYITLFGTLLAAQLLILFLPAVVGVAIAAFQVRKAEVAAAQAAAMAAESPAGDAPDGDVIDVDEVDDEEVEEVEDLGDLDEVEADEQIEAEEAEASDELIEAELVDEDDQRSV